MAAAVVACDRVLVAEPRPSDLAGVYRLAPESETFLRERKGYSSLPSCSVELRPDSSFSIRNLPDCAVDGFGQGEGKFLSANGNWKIEKAFIGFGLTLDIAPGGSMEPMLYVGFLDIRGRAAPYDLEITIGDPDSGESIRLKKVRPRSKPRTEAVL